MGQMKNKSGFTLAEVMVVLLVITILFAVFAPFMTKRRNATLNSEDIWSWVSRNFLSGPMNAYFKPPAQGGVFIGVAPDSQSDIMSSYTPFSKMTVRSGYIANNVIQRQLQLRYGRKDYEDPGTLAATFLADGNNLLFGADYPSLKVKKSDNTYPHNNVAFGYNSMNSMLENDNASLRIERNTALGANSLSNIKTGKDNTSIGANSGLENETGNGNTFIGFNAGSLTTGSFNTLIGYNSEAINGEYNTLIGANTGYKYVSDKRDPYSYNVAAGYQALSKITTGKYNVAIGAGALQSLKTGLYNVAIGYNACSNIEGQSYKTCIGANSGPAANSSVVKDLKLAADDTAQRTYIGANPSRLSVSGFGGDAVMEIHNLNTKNDSLINDPLIKSNTTTIINGNLIVKGKTYLTMGNDLYPFFYKDNIFGSPGPCTRDQVSYIYNHNNPYCIPLTPIFKAASDRRLKNIKSRNNSGLDKIKQLKVYNYKFKNDAKKEKHVGVIAQDLQKIFPNSVYKDDKGYLKITTDEIFYAMINAINELNKKLESYIAKVAALDKDINKMESENKKLQLQVEELSSHIEKLKNQKN